MRVSHPINAAEEGSTLVEVAVAAALLATVAIPLLAWFSPQRGAAVEHAVHALALARSAVEETRGALTRAPAAVPHDAPEEDAAKTAAALVRETAQGAASRWHALRPSPHATPSPRITASRRAGDKAGLQLDIELRCVSSVAARGGLAGTALPLPMLAATGCPGGLVQITATAQVHSASTRTLSTLAYVPPPTSSRPTWGPR